MTFAMMYFQCMFLTCVLHTFCFYVQDSGENSTNTNVSILRIKIKDHDDQPGKFLQSKYFATIPENLPKVKVY